MRDKETAKDLWKRLESAKKISKKLASYMQFEDFVLELKTLGAEGKRTVCYPIGSTISR